MANRLLPFRQYDENDVINLFANVTADDKPDTNGAGSAGVFVQISNGDFSNDPVVYKDHDLGATYSHTKNQYPTVPMKVTAATVGALAGTVIGVTLKQTLVNDENSERLLYNPVKKDELQAVLSGQAVPVATRGIFTLTNDAFDAAADGTNSCVPGYAAVISPGTAGKVSGVAFSSLWAFSSTLGSNIPTGVEHITEGGTVVKYTPNHVVGTWIGTGTRTSVGPITDAYAGFYSVLKLNL
tara:strand:+ start:354 stop:1073 length:720 start_codon:yes stop_codon:yes gene_type:complete